VLLLFEPGKMMFDDDMADNSSTALETLVSPPAPWTDSVSASLGNKS
jgi:hypothetical protein